MIIAGVGCRKGATAAAVEAAIDTALSHVGRGADALALIATSAAKGKELGIMDTAVRLGVPLILVGQRELQAAGQRAETQSERVMALTGVPSLAEAAALAAPGRRFLRKITQQFTVGYAWDLWCFRQPVIPEQFHRRHGAAGGERAGGRQRVRAG